MSAENRAKIFCPFAALRGHKEALADKAEQKLAVRQSDLLDDSKQELDESLAAIAEYLERGNHPTVKVCYFVQDKVLAVGIGRYENVEGVVAKLDVNERYLQVVNRKIMLDDIHNLVVGNQ